MFCPSCGKDIKSGEDFCPHCGNKVDVPITIQVENKSKNAINNIKSFFGNMNKKLKISLIAILVCIFASITGIIIYNNVHDFTTIKWKDNCSDCKLTIVQPTTLNLEVSAFDKENKEIKDLTYSVNGGEINSNKNTVSWKLPKEKGEYEITVTTPSGKKLKKSIKVVLLENELLGGVVKQEEEIDESYKDSDYDGLPDKIELEVTKTDPNKADSDDDGLNDGNEMDLNLNPLSSDSLGDGIKDGERELTYTTNNEKSSVSLEITGKGNIVNTTIDTFKTNLFKNAIKLTNTIYNFQTEGILKKATVKIKYNLEDLTNNNINEDEIVLYYYDDKNNKLESVPTTIDKENKIITATLDHFSKYVIGGNNAKLPDNKLLLLIDNSVSMYTYNQMVDMGFEYSTGAEGNDSDFKRITLTKKFVDMTDDNYSYSVVSFAGNTKKIQAFDSSKDKTKESLDSIKNNLNGYTSGTNIVSSIKSSINDFEEIENNNYILLMTDGKDTTETLPKEKESIIEEANKKNVSICIIGLGNVDSEILSDIATSTNCAFYNAKDGDALENIYSLMLSKVTGKSTKGTIYADSGFITTRDGFAFSNNFQTNNSTGGHCFGLATFALLYYKQKLPMSLDYLDNSSLLNKFNSSDGYNLNNTYFSSYKPLYNYSFTSPGLDMIFNQEPSDYRDRIEDGVWKIKKEYAEKIEKVGGSINIGQSNNYEFNILEYPIIDVTSNNFKNNTDKDDRELLNAIWRLFILQNSAKRYSFNSEPDKTFNKLVEDLSSGTPSVMIFNDDDLFSRSAHAVNAISLIQDNNDSNKFYLEIYDNNYAGETRTIEISRKKYSKFAWKYVAWTNEYQYFAKYDSNNDGVMENINLNISLIENGIK